MVGQLNSVKLRKFRVGARVPNVLGREEGQHLAPQRHLLKKKASD
jgi:hypothetical protein